MSQGTESEWGTIDPVVKFYHRCNNLGLFDLPKVSLIHERPRTLIHDECSFQLCRRKQVYEIPESYVVEGQVSNK